MATSEVYRPVERRTRPLKWVAAALLFLPVIALADERRCTELGADCLCNEPLNTSTHGGGNTNWNSSIIDPDDSSDARECTRNGGSFAVNDGASVVTAASQAAFLPSGHSLSYVFRRLGNTTSQVATPPLNEASPNVTVCSRIYRRWGVGSQMPPDANAQMKVANLGGWVGSIANPWQISVSGPGGGGIHTRFDGNWFAAPPDFQLLPFNLETDCERNFCRFEICLDHLADGNGRLRLRMTRLTPGSPASQVVNKPAGTISRPNLPFTQGSYLFNFWSTGFVQDTYNTHGMEARTRPANSNWWIGPACEVEGGCNGAPPPPPPMPPIAPVLEQN